ncbi:MAG: helix-turn-helix transcriptional regulator [Bradyrhizobium sp.]|nr:helix-turn-helix transcriptional regulator [Bradyrhizobium sp.]
MTGQFASLQTQEVRGFEEFGEVIVGARRKVIQIQDGKLRGRLAHASLGRLRIDLANFNLGLRTSGVSGKDGIVLGMLAASADRVTRFTYESQPGDVMVTPPGTEHENRYYGGASVIVASILSDDISASFASEGALSDPAAWQRSHFKGNACTAESVIPRLQSLVARLGDASLNAEAAEFWKRAVIEAMSASVVEGLSSERDGPLPSALKIVRQVDEYLDAAEPAPIHISQICSHLRLSRRTLHRAFHEALGIGPITYLRHRRLCAVHSALRAPKDIRTISDIALQHGFQNLGRFACYYRELFGEYPSETRAQIHERTTEALLRERASRLGGTSLEWL